MRWTGTVLVDRQENSRPFGRTTRPGVDVRTTADDGDTVGG